VTVYLDSSILVALFTDDPLTDRAKAFLATDPFPMVISDFASAEFASAIARRVRMQNITPDNARIGFSSFDIWKGRAARHVETEPSDIAAAAAFLRRLDLNLRTPDALNIAIAQRIGASLATFDAGMIANSRSLGVQVAAA
jgi:uncharacterized protein